MNDCHDNVGLDGRGSKCPGTPLRRASEDAYEAPSTGRADECHERVVELRRRVAGGVYASPRVVDVIARRILASGDLDGMERR